MGGTLNEAHVSNGGLSESERRLQLALDTAELGSWRLEADGLHLEVCPRFLGQVGGNESAMARLDDLLAVLHPEDAQQLQRAVHDCFAHGIPVNLECRSRHSSAGLRWLRLHATRHDTSSGEAAPCLIGISRDATRRRRAEDAAQASAAEVRLIADAMPVLISYLDRDLHYRFVNRTYEEWFGVPLSEIVGNPISRLVDPDAIKERMPYLRRALAGEETRIEVPWPCPDGVTRHTEIRYIPKFTDGVPDGLYVFVADFTERELTARRQSFLLQLDDRLRDIADDQIIVSETASALAGMLAVRGAIFAELDPADTAHMDVEQTERCLRVLPAGQPLQALRGALLDRLLSGSALQLVDVGREPTLDSADRQALVRAQIGALQAVSILRQDRVVAVLLVHHDVARTWSHHETELIRTVAERAWVAVERARAERALRELNATLELRIEERTRALRDAEAALRQAQKMEAIGQLTGGIAHDLNNMLQGILGPLELLPRLINAGRREETDHYIRAATNASQRAAGLTHRLLAFARRQSLDVRAVDVNRLVLSMEDLMRRTLGRGMQLVLALDEGAWLAVSDANQLESALLNVTINARDAMSDTGRLSIETANRCVQPQSPEVAEGVEPGDYVCISVRDNGSGMTEEVQAKVFDPFFTTKPVGQGSGLGLSMVWGFVKQCGGHVLINSRPAVGTVVRLYLPRHVGEQPENAGNVVNDEQPGKGERILVVEDDETVRVLVTTLVEELGYGAIAVADARAALELLETDLPLDLLLTDISLPGLGGCELAVSARQLRPQLKVLFMTGYAPNALLRSGFIEPGMDLLNKPFTLASLTDKLNALLCA